MWQAVELREVRAFLLLAEELHFGRAAKRAGLTQSRISQTLQALERKLGVELVHRTSRRVALTAEGARFREDAAAALDSLDWVLRTTQEAAMELTVPLRVGVVSPAAVNPRLQAIVDRYVDTYPGSAVQYVGLPFRDRFGPLRRGEVELMVAALPLAQPDLVVGPVLSRDGRLLAVGRGHPLAGQDEVHVEALSEHSIADLDLVVPAELADAMAPRATPRGLPIPRTHVDAHEVSDLLMAVALGQVVQPITAAFAATYRHPDVRFVPLTGLPYSRTALVWRKRDRDRRLRAFLKEAAAVRRDHRP